VAAVAVFGVADERWGACVAAAIVRDTRIDTRGDTPWLVWLGATLRTRLASHKLPRFVAVLDALPMRATGKVDRAALTRDVAPRLVAWPV
jgi:O-succinylbenzoic acid--CoA ligase